MSATLRLNPSVAISSTLQVTEPIEIRGVPVSPDVGITINIRGLHHNPHEWQEPESFIPERFDSESKWFLTPSGKKRHPMSFGPFLGGKRICLGKTFAEKMAKIMSVIIISQLEFSFED